MNWVHSTFHELHATLSTLKQDAAAGRLDRREQLVLLELAEYGLFYTSFYERLLRHMRSQKLPHRG